MREPQGSVLAGGEVRVAESEPGFVPEFTQRVDQCKTVALEPETTLAIDPSGQGVGDDVEVG